MEKLSPGSPCIMKYIFISKRLCEALTCTSEYSERRLRPAIFSCLCLCEKKVCSVWKLHLSRRPHCLTLSRSSNFFCLFVTAPCNVKKWGDRGCVSSFCYVEERYASVHSVFPILYSLSSVMWLKEDSFGTRGRDSGSHRQSWLFSPMQGNLQGCVELQLNFTS